MKRVCTVSGKEFDLREQDLTFYDRMGVPIPQLHPNEILRRLMACRNESKFYRRKCDASGDTIISAYSTDVPFPVYKNEIWWGDSWDPLEYGVDVDFSMPFFEQFISMRNRVPREGTTVFKSENCAYNAHIRESKNCYLCSLTYRAEDCYYSHWLVDDKDLVGCRMMTNSELCYESLNCVNCFECVLLQEGTNCSECFFSYQLRGCDHCIGCSNLNNKSYYVFNKKVTLEEFEKTKKQVLDGTYTTWKKGLYFFQKMWNGAIHRFAHNLNCENVAGDILINCRNCYHTFEGWESEECVMNVSCDHSNNIYHSYSVGWPASELVHYSAVTRGSSDIRFCYYIWFSNNLTYCDSCSSCQDCFGCVGLKHKKYCLFNKQYTKEEYFILRDKVVEYMKKTKEWGTFPQEFSTYCYNETAAQDYYFPLTKEEVIEMGWKWRDEDATTKYEGPPVKIPDSIRDVEEDICNKILTCEKTGKNYRIQKGEFKFCQKMNLPISRLCPDVRKEEQNKRRNPNQLWTRKCDKCSVEIQTTFAPERPEKVYCEKCYLEEVN